ncbi:hypothetical protein HOLleu_44629 [Holothuria leucospilota]|uniref:Uncharacterized protein n=1 Tax=Holothuria leucospilota TaxID=206669 RepID=A0A9Q1BAS1_HOLLE|nr:hypothetical protein HOLleu_44629 [Holothuria leucospilota]
MAKALKCGHVIPGDAKVVIWHLRHVHNVFHGRSFTESITCGQDGCERTFSGRTYVFRKHLRNHRDVQLPAPMDFALPQNHESDSDSSDDGDIENAPLNEVPIPKEDMWDDFDAEKVERHASGLVAGLLASNSRAHSTVLDVVEKTADLLDDISSLIK